MENPFQKVIEGVYLAAVKYAPSMPESTKWIQAMEEAASACKMFDGIGLSDEEIVLKLLTNMQKAHSMTDEQIKRDNL